MREEIEKLKKPDVDNEEYSSLIISVKKGDEIIIGDSIIRFVEYKKQWCRLRINAKKIVPIKRLHHHKKTTSS